MVANLAFVKAILVLNRHETYRIRRFGSVTAVKLGTATIGNVRRLCREWVKCVTRTGVGKPVLGFYASLKYIYSSKTNKI